MSTLVAESDRVESLRQLLAKQQQRKISRKEAMEVGESLITFFQALGAS
jgi:hypothetical protein